jgi:hypothetical protein
VSTMIPDKFTTAVTGDSPEAVAFALAMLVSHRETMSKAPEPGATREYWLTLYRECLAAVRGHSPSAPTPPSAPPT